MRVRWNLHWKSYIAAPLLLYISDPLDPARLIFRNSIDSISIIITWKILALWNIQSVPGFDVSHWIRSRKFRCVGLWTLFESVAEIRFRTIPNFNFNIKHSTSVACCSLGLSRMLFCDFSTIISDWSSRKAWIPPIPLFSLENLECLISAQGTYTHSILKICHARIRFRIGFPLAFPALYISEFQYLGGRKNSVFQKWK